MQGEKVENYSRSAISMGDPAKYGSAYGILTYRGGPLRQNGAYGRLNVSEEALAAEQAGTELAAKLVMGRRTMTIRLADGSTGFGFSSQELIIKWPGVMREVMNVYP